MTSRTLTEEAASVAEPDAINKLAGLQPGAALYELRAGRPDVQKFAQGSYLALLEPGDPAGVSSFEREAVALRVAVLTANEPLAAFHRARLHQSYSDDQTLTAIETFPIGDGLSRREKAILAHTDLLTREPRASGEVELAALQQAGLSPADIVTISQLIAFLSFEVRVLAALRALGEE